MLKDGLLLVQKEILKTFFDVIDLRYSCYRVWNIRSKTRSNITFSMSYHIWLIILVIYSANGQHIMIFNVTLWSRDEAATIKDLICSYNDFLSIVFSFLCLNWIQKLYGLRSLFLTIWDAIFIFCIFFHVFFN